MSLVEHREGIEAGRLDMFVDGAFAFTLTLLAIGGETVLANVGGNLSIESLQDDSTYHSKQTSGGASVSTIELSLLAMLRPSASKGAASVAAPRSEGETCVGEREALKDKPDHNTDRNCKAEAKQRKCTLKRSIFSSKSCKRPCWT